ncbi:MAG: hypothetical protein FWC36_06890 [Spirochaetes bacterium]|nr:hypothetical protein [Spirochaetota bacterium]
MSLVRYIMWFFLGVKVFALVGRSGTGKSFRAKLIAEKYGIDLIVDDGLLIKEDNIIAGKSAKKEEAFLTAIKTALFDDATHRTEVQKALAKTKFKRILLIGTSDKMVSKIAKKLKLPQPSKIIRIEDIATKEEINYAIHSRNTEGKHIIPVPSVVIQKNYPTIFADSIRVFMKKNFFKDPKAFDKAVVQPSFSEKKGAVTMSETALTQMLSHCADEYDPFIKINKIKVKHDTSGYSIKLYLKLPYMLQISGKVHGFQQYLITSLERHAGIIVKEISLKIENFIRTQDSSKPPG